MDITITINTDNDTFGNEPTHEVSRILRELVNKVDATNDVPHLDRWPLRDYNGNVVGRVTITTE